MPLMMPPAVLEELLLEELPPNKPPRIPAIADPLLEAAVDAVEGVVDVSVLEVSEVDVVAFAVVVFLVVVFFVVVFLVDFFVVFFTGQLVVSERDTSFHSLAILPDVQASTRAAIKNTFFIPFIYYISISLLHSQFECKVRKNNPNKGRISLFSLSRIPKMYF